MRLSRDNHFVPQMYLKNWGDNGRIFVYRLLVPHENVPLWKQHPIKTTAEITNLYMRIEDGAEIDNFELDFNKMYETPAKPVIEKVATGQKLTRDDWKVLSDYILLQYVRTPSFYHWTAEWGKGHVESMLSSTIKEALKKLETTKATPSLDNNGESDLLPISIGIQDDPKDDTKSILEVQTVVGKNLWLFAIHRVLAKESVVRKFVQELKWSIVTAAEGETWPTCDAPVIITKRNEANVLTKTNQLSNKRTLVVFPVSPSVVLIGCRRRDFPWRFQADRIFTKTIKDAIVNNALRYVYSSWADPEIQIIRERTVSQELFIQDRDEYASWYTKYKRDEAPLLKKR